MPRCVERHPRDSGESEHTVPVAEERHRRYRLPELVTEDVAPVIPRRAARHSLLDLPRSMPTQRIQSQITKRDSTARRPRLRLGAETGNAPADIELDGEVAELEDVLARAGAQVLMIDTLVSHIPGRFDAHKEQHVRHVLAPLAHMAERLGIAVIATMHLNRREASDVLTRISGSGGFGNLARSVLLLAPDPDDPDGPTRMLAHAKANVGLRAPTIRLRIDGAQVIADDGDVLATSRVILLGEAPEFVAAELLTRAPEGEERSIREEVMEYLRQLLAGGRVAANEARTGATRETGASTRRVVRAKDTLGVISEREGFGPGSRVYWRLPTECATSTHRAPRRHAGTL